MLEGTNCETIRSAILERLPEEQMTIRMPNSDGVMSLVSAAYDRTNVDLVDYVGGTVTLECRGCPEMLERFRGRAAQLE